MITVVDHTRYCANTTCRVPLHRIPSIRIGLCCCHRGTCHDAEPYLDTPDAAAQTLPVVSGNQRDRAGLLGGTEPAGLARPGGFVSHPRDVA